MYFVLVCRNVALERVIFAAKMSFGHEREYLFKTNQETRRGMGYQQIPILHSSD
jgi:hypothetical protein